MVVTIGRADRFQIRMVASTDNETLWQFEEPVGGFD